MILKDIMETVSRQTGAIVNIHPRHPRMWDIKDLERLPRQNYHHGDYCQFRKLNGKQPACARNKNRSLERALQGKSFWGTCPFGVWDFAQPVMFENELIAVIYLGHFASNVPLADIDGSSYNGIPLETITEKKQRHIRYYADFIASFIRLACRKWIDEGNHWEVNRSAGFYEDITRHFIASHYTDPIRLQDLAVQLGVTPNHLGGVIKKRLGQPFKKLLENYRIEQAKVALKSHPHLNITQIAFACGFSDSNYFSTVFKKATGLPPRAYRKSNPTTAIH
jgi:AraC-like DNA-binding protein